MQNDSTGPFRHWKKILVPTDFSEDSLRAVHEARCFQNLTGAEVVLVHVTEPAFEGLRIHTGEFHDECQRTARQQLTALVDRHFGGSSAVTVLVKEGRAGEVICELARTVAADVVIIASHGISAMKHFVLGSVAEKVVRHAPCSVLVVR
jgi:nucleotide-binding universal stress UspA family protein